ncbi:uncharacterized [Tachysurus ichikawai]
MAGLREFLCHRPPALTLHPSLSPPSRPQSIPPGLRQVPFQSPVTLIMSVGTKSGPQSVPLWSFSPLSNLPTLLQPPREPSLPLSYTDMMRPALTPTSLISPCTELRAVSPSLHQTPPHHHPPHQPPPSQKNPSIPDAISAPITMGTAVWEPAAQLGSPK